MSDYQRLNFRQEFYDKVSDYLRENPQEGFESDEVKQFIKVVINKYIEDEFVEEKTIEEQRKQLEKLTEKIENNNI